MDKAARAALLTAKGMDKKRAGYALSGGVPPKPAVKNPMLQEAYFAGPKAKTFADAPEAHKFITPDEVTRFEQPDNEAASNIKTAEQYEALRTTPKVVSTNPHNDKVYSSGVRTLGDLYQHPTLYKDYPELFNAPVYMNPLDAHTGVDGAFADQRNVTRGNLSDFMKANGIPLEMYNSKTGAFVLSPNFVQDYDNSGGISAYIRKILGHETQHWIDNQEQTDMYGTGRSRTGAGAADYYDRPTEATAYYTEDRMDATPEERYGDIQGVSDYLRDNAQWAGAVGKSKGGALDLARAVMAKNRAGGQIAPSKYLPNVPRQVHADGGKVAYHATHEPFEDYDWSRLGQSTKENTSGTSVDDWASSLASLGPWAHEKPLSKRLGMKTDLPVTLTGKEKKFKSLDHLAQEISQHGGPAALREKLVSQGYGHASVDDEEFGGKSYVGLSPDHFKITKAGAGEVVNLGKEKLVRSITKAASDVKSGAHQENMDRRAYKLHESGHLPLPIGTKVTPPQGWDMPSELHIHGYWQDILHPEQHGYKLKSENGDVYEVQHQMHSGQNPYVFGGGFKAYSGPVRNRAGYSDEAMASRNPILPTRTPEQSDQLNKEYDQLFGNNPNITKAEGGRIHAEGGGKMELRSRAAEAIRNQAQLKGSVDQLLAATAKGKGVKQAELANAGRPSGNIISKEELARHFEEAVPKVQVTKYGAKPLSDDEKREYQELGVKREKGNLFGNEARRFFDLNDKINGNTQYSEYSLPGGENYSEHVLHLLKGNVEPFYSDHWQDPNVLAHLRMDDRDNGKTLHVQEIQSDWGQKGRETGFYDPAKPIEVFHTGTGQTVHATDDMGYAKAKAEQLGPQYDYGHQGDDKVPQGPYVGNTQQWTDLAIKHALTEAAKGGYDRVVFSPGEANADLYDQRTPVSSFVLNKTPNSTGIGMLGAYGYGRENQPPIFKKDIADEKDLKKLVGREHAAKLLAAPSVDHGDGLSAQSISEPDMHLGGHGMVDYYNNIVHPSALKHLQQHDPSIKPEDYALPPIEEGNDGYKGFSLPMTDTARQSILKNGFGAFKRGGMVNVDNALALTRRFTKDGIGATMALKPKGE